MRTPQWVKKLGGHAGELYVAAELSKRGIPNSLLPENFSDDDIMIGKKNGSETAYIQVKSCHPVLSVFRQRNEIVIQYGFQHTLMLFMSSVD